MDAILEEMIADHMGLAQSLAQQVWAKAPHALDLDELKGIAYLGLVGAAVRWRPYCLERNFSPEATQFFRPYVVRRVRGALIDEIRRADFASRALRTRARALQDAGQDRGLTDVELARRSGLTVAEVRSTVRGMAQRPVSIEAEELDPESAHTVESAAFVQGVLRQFVDAVRELGLDQQAVVMLHYWRGMQLQEVAKTMGITESRASQLHADAVLTVHGAMVNAAGTTRS